MIAPIAPLELKIELTHACNLRCSFCYLDGGTGHGSRFMLEEAVFRWIDWAQEKGIPAVRFTGGEATLHPLIETFVCYAHLRKRYTILNTNGSADEGLYKSLFPLVNDVRISLPTLEAERMDALTGAAGMLKKKEKTIEMALDIGVGRVCLLTPLLPELHGKLEAFVSYIEERPRLVWMPLRYESSPANSRPWTSDDAQSFAEEMADLMRRYPGKVEGIYLATPFCSVRPMELGARVFHGRAEDCGPFKALNVNAAGRMQACFDVGEVGYAGPSAEIRDMPEVVACASLAALPDQCRVCAYVARCAGGCRKPYGMVCHDGRWIDYLAGFLAGNESGGMDT